MHTWCTIFLDIGLPNATTWFYLSIVLVFTIFFRFRRPFQLRNFDLILLFLLVPPMLFLRSAQMERRLEQNTVLEHGQQILQILNVAANEVAVPAHPNSSFGLLHQAVNDINKIHFVPAMVAKSRPGQHHIWVAYLWLLIASAFICLRSLIDLVLIRKSALETNLTMDGMAWLALALFLTMSTWSFLPKEDIVPQSQSQSMMLEKLTQLLDVLIDQLSWFPLTTVQFNGVLALTSHALLLLALFWIGYRHAQSATMGMASVLLYLLLPYTAYHLTDLDHVVPAMLLVMALAFYRWPLAAGTCMALASCLSFFPLLLIPLWMSFYRKAGWLRFIFPLLLALFIVMVLLMSDQRLQVGLQQALDRPEWQAWRFSDKPTAEGLWTGYSLHYAYRLPLFIGYFVLVVASLFWPSPKTLGHLVSWSATLVIGVQFWYADAGGIYVLWYLPLLIMLMLRPTWSECMPQVVAPEQDWLIRLARWIKQRLKPKAKPQTASRAPALTTQNG